MQLSKEMSGFRFYLAVAFLLVGISVTPAQLVYNGLVSTPAGSVSRLLQFQNGVVTEMSTGVAHSFLPSISRDGRFVTFSGVDPLRPNQASSDLFLFDRATGRSTTLIDNTARTLRDQTITSIQPIFSALSPDNRFVAVHSILATFSANGGGAIEDLEVFPTSGQGPSSWVERSTGELNNLYGAEFMGISWSPDGSVFATSAAIPLPSINGFNTTLPGIVTYAFNANVAPFGAWQRVAHLSAVSNTNFVDHFQVFPAFSPDGRRIAFFDIRATPVLTEPYVATLVVANADGSQAQALTTFSPGLFPSGCTWAADGSLVIFSVGQQVAIGFGPGNTQYFARVVPETSIIRAIDSVRGGAPFQLPNVNAGYAPTNAFAASQPSGNSQGVDRDMRSVPVRMIPRADGGFVFLASGLDPNATYLFESSTTLSGFPNSQQFSGNEIMQGITIPRNERQKFFRIVLTN